MTVRMPSKKNPVNCPGRGCKRPDNPFQLDGSFRRHVIKEHFGYPNNDPRAYDRNGYPNLDTQHFLNFLNSNGQILHPNCPKSLEDATMPPPPAPAQPVTLATSSRKRTKDTASPPADGQVQGSSSGDSPPRKIPRGIDEQQKKKQEDTQDLRLCHGLLTMVLRNEGDTPECFSKIPNDNPTEGPNIFFGSKQEVENKNRQMLQSKGVKDPHILQNLMQAFTGYTNQEPFNGKFNLRINDPQAGTLLPHQNIVPYITKPRWADFITGELREAPQKNIQVARFFNPQVPPKITRDNLKAFYIKELSEYRQKNNIEAPDERFNLPEQRVNGVGLYDQVPVGHWMFENMGRSGTQHFSKVHPLVDPETYAYRPFATTKQELAEKLIADGMHPSRVDQSIGDASKEPADGLYNPVTLQLVSGQPPVETIRNTNHPEWGSIEMVTAGHVQSLLQRYASVMDGPAVRQSLLNRFISGQEERKALERANEGKVQILEGDARWTEIDALASKREGLGLSGSVQKQVKRGNPTRDIPKTVFPSRVPGDMPSPENAPTPIDIGTPSVPDEPGMDVRYDHKKGHYYDASGQPPIEYGTPATSAPTPKPLREISMGRVESTVNTPKPIQDSDSDDDINNFEFDAFLLNQTKDKNVAQS